MEQDKQVKQQDAKHVQQDIILQVQEVRHVQNVQQENIIQQQETQHVQHVKMDIIVQEVLVM